MQAFVSDIRILPQAFPIEKNNAPRVSANIVVSSEVKYLIPESGKERLRLIFWHKGKKQGTQPNRIRVSPVLKIHIELAEKFHQSGLQFVSSLTKYEDVLQSQNDDLQKQVVSLKSLVSENYSTSIPLCVSSELPESYAGSISSE